MVSAPGAGDEMTSMIADVLYDAFDDIRVIEDAEAVEQTPFADNLLHLAFSNKQAAKALVVGSAMPGLPSRTIYYRAINGS